MPRKSRRDFVRQCVAAVGGASLARRSGLLTVQAAPEPPVTNWAGNYTYSVSTVAKAATRQQVQDFIRQHDHLRVLGTRHCFNGIADSTARLLSVARHGPVSSRWITTAQDGDRRGGHELRPAVPVSRTSRAFALHNLASLPHISVAGACATATHGSGVSNGNLSTAVSALELVTADGDVVSRLARDKDAGTFPRLPSCTLGALGVVTKVTLDVQPTFDVRQDVYVDLPMAQSGITSRPSSSAGYSVSLFTDWQKGRVNEVWVKRRVEQGRPITVDREFYGATARRRRTCIRSSSCRPRTAPSRWAYRARGTTACPTSAWGSRRAAARSCSPSTSSRARNAVEAILAIERLRDHVSPHLMISELRTIDADELWMSPCYKRPSLAIHFTWKPDWDAVRQVLPMIERELAPFDVRPHWGKLFTIPPKTLQGRYPKCEDFKRLVAEHDPQGKFRNAFLTTNLYG